MDTLVIAHELIYFAILPSFLFAVSLILCASPRSQRRSIEETKSNKKDTTSNEIKKTGKKRSKTKTTSTESIRMQKARKSKRELKMKKSKRSSLSGKSLERFSSGLTRSSRWERFRERPTNGTVSCTTDEKLKNGIKMEPRLLNWNISGGIQKVYFTNYSNERRAIKVKCSDNYLYRVSRVFTFIEPGEMIGIDIVRQNGGAKPDKMIFLWTKAETSDNNASKLFNKVSTYPMLVLPLTVNNPTD